MLRPGFEVNYTAKYQHDIYRGRILQMIALNKNMATTPRAFNYTPVTLRGNLDPERSPPTRHTDPAVPSSALGKQIPRIRGQPMFLVRSFRIRGVSMRR